MFSSELFFEFVVIFDLHDVSSATEKNEKVNNKTKQ